MAVWYVYTVPFGRSPLSGIHGTEAEVSKGESVHLESPEVSNECGIEPPIASAAVAGPRRDRESHYNGTRRHEHASYRQRIWDVLPGIPNISTVPFVDQVLASMSNVLNLSPSLCITNSTAMTSYPLQSGPACLTHGAGSGIVRANKFFF